MLYIISGASRAGKTLIAQRIQAERGLSYLSLDWLIMGFTNGIPEYGIHDKLFPDEIAERSWSFIKAMLESMIYAEADCIVEGEAMLPELIIELKDRYPDKLMICFMGYAEVTIAQKVKDIKENGKGENDWLLDESDEYIIDHVRNMIAHSKKIEKSCRNHDLKYIDTSRDFLSGMDKIIDYFGLKVLTTNNKISKR